MRPFDYFRTRTSPGRDQQIAERLWNGAVGAEQYSADDLAYRSAILEQYKLYVEMADRISARRGLANTFFLTLNTAVFALVGAFWDFQPSTGTKWHLFPLVALIIQCGSWFWTIRSYRQLNSAKFAVVGHLENRLPALPYSDAEWAALAEGKEPAVYWPLTKVESTVPALFAATYLVAIIATIIA